LGFPGTIGYTPIRYLKPAVSLQFFSLVAPLSVQTC
jgi:hypothetical protein